MSSEWIANEIEGVRLGDKRLEKRLAQTLETLAGGINKSISHAVKGRAEREAIYRFIDNSDVDYDKIIAPHHAKTNARAQMEKIVLFVQDTTEINLTRAKQQVQGAGPLMREETKRFGCLIHAMQVFTIQGIPLGLYWEKRWTRPMKKKSSGKAREKELRHLPFEEKESFRWLEGVRQAIDFASANQDVTTICIGDRESDIYEIFAEPRRSSNYQLLVRGCYDRSIESSETQEFTHIREKVEHTPILATTQTRVRSRTAKTNIEIRPDRIPRDSRDATLTIRASSVNLKSRGTSPAIPLNVVLVQETNAPEGVVPIEWLLLTTLPVGTALEATQVVEYYRVRWQIEIFFRVLKQGCLVEKRRFETLERIYNCLSLYMIIAWHIMYLCYMSRSFPEASCELLYEPSEWKAVVSVRERSRRIPERPPTLGEMTLYLAELGGYKRSSYAPGVETVWKGLRDMTIMAACWDSFGPESQHFT